MTLNQITCVSLAIGLGCAWCYAQGSRLWALIGALLLTLSYILDNCDGEIARVKGLESRFGDRFDTFADWLVHASLFVALGVGADASAPQGPWLLLGWIAVAGSSINYALVIALDRGTRGVPQSQPGTSLRRGNARSWLDQVIYVFRELTRADFCFLLLALTLFDVAWWLLPTAAIGSQVYWMAAIVERIRSNSGGREDDIRYLKLIYLLVGVTLLGWVAMETDLEEVGRRIALMQWGIVVVLAIYFLEFLLDAAAWGLTVRTIHLDSLWMFRLWKVRMVGEAFNQVTPLATIGGEPVKAQLLKERYELPYREGITSLLVAKTTVLMALGVFLAGGFVCILQSPVLPAPYKQIAGLGLAAFGVGITLLFVAQRLRVVTRISAWMNRWSSCDRTGDVLNKCRDVEDRLVQFYTGHQKRFTGAILLALFAWLLGLPELYLTMLFLGHPIGLSEAWVIETVAQLIRLGTFFIPGSLGAQEGAFYLVYSAMGMDPALGLAVAMVRRFREVVWILWGLALGWTFAFQTEAP